MVRWRTTLNLDDDVLRAIRSLAKERGESLGAVVSALVREALRPPERVTYVADLPVRGGGKWLEYG